ncbi:sugar phosphate isomerase/epimerase family protein [Streptomyces sp. NPDC059740]|uniref:sugar phosphate isomerase/epimerase family protein n=1 Tax=Streptomyces sp. NPDC059740 TaxID=3346926 RepID=UPI0036628082
MRLAFSTLGVPGLPVDDVLRLAGDSGFHGVELRAHPEEPVHPGITGDERASVRRRFAAAGVEVLAVAGYAKVAAALPEAAPRDAGPGATGPASEEELAADLTELVVLAADLGAPYVRVFPGGGDRPAAEADADAARRLGALAPFAAEHGVTVLLETHDSHRTGYDAARVLGPVGHPNAGVLWDVMHTWLGGEDPATSCATLLPHLGYVQVKDIASEKDTTPLPLGAGVLPLAECVEELTRAEWDGWLCWEYEKRWYPHAAELPELLPAGREHVMRLLTESS